VLKSSSYIEWFATCFLLCCDPEAQVGDRLELPNISNEAHKLQSKDRATHTNISFLKLSSQVTCHEGSLADTTISYQQKLKINSKCDQAGLEIHDSIQGICRRGAHLN
jgi:hypothetical protein